MAEKRFRVILAIVAVIFSLLFVSALLAVNFIFSEQEEKNGLQQYLQIGKEIHEELQSTTAEARKMLPGKDQIDLNDPEIRMVFALHESIVGDLEWVFERETENYNKLMQAESEEEAERLAEKEIVYAFIAEYSLMANMTLEELELPNESAQEEIIEYARHALERKEQFEVDEDLLRDLKEYYGISSEKAIESLKGIMREYADYLEKELENAVKNNEKERAYIEARKTIIIFMN